MVAKHMHYTGTSQEATAGITKLKFMLSALACILFMAAIYAILKGGHQNPTASVSVSSSTATNTAVSQYTVLAPATESSKTAECSQQISYSSNGNSGPITCTDGDLNVLEWNALAALEPKVMTLGYSATASQVEAMLCSDASDSDSDATTQDSKIIETTTYQISALYYGWNFAVNPTTALTNGSC